MRDENTVFKSRHLPEKHGAFKALYKEVNKHLEKNSLKWRERSGVDATIFFARRPTKNSTGKRYPKTHQTRMGDEWHFGMKMLLGVDDALDLIHSIDTIAANIHGSVFNGKLLHGEERRVFGDAGYLAIQKGG